MPNDLPRLAGQEAEGRSLIESGDLLRSISRAEARSPEEISAKAKELGVASENGILKFEIKPDQDFGELYTRANRAANDGYPSRILIGNTEISVSEGDTLRSLAKAMRHFPEDFKPTSADRIPSGIDNWVYLKNGELELGTWGIRGLANAIKEGQAVSEVIDAPVNVPWNNGSVRVLSGLSVADLEKVYEHQIISGKGWTDPDHVTRSQTAERARIESELSSYHSRLEQVRQASLGTPRNMAELVGADLKTKSNTAGIIQFYVHTLNHPEEIRAFTQEMAKIDKTTLTAELKSMLPRMPVMAPYWQAAMEEVNKQGVTTFNEAFRQTLLRNLGDAVNMQLNSFEAKRRSIAESAKGDPRPFATMMTELSVGANAGRWRGNTFGYAMDTLSHPTEILNFVRQYDPTTPYNLVRDLNYHAGLGGGPGGTLPIWQSAIGQVIAESGQAAAKRLEIQEAELRLRPQLAEVEAAYAATRGTMDSAARAAIGSDLELARRHLASPDAQSTELIQKRGGLSGVIAGARRTISNHGGKLSAFFALGIMSTQAPDTY